MSSWTIEGIPDQTGKTVVITGANSGIGWEAAAVLASKRAEVVLACRTPSKGEEAVARIRALHPAANVKLMKLDLASLASVRTFADEFKAKHARLDVLINNAGLMAIPHAKTEDGFEMQLGTNHLGHFALTGALFDKLGASAPARVVTVSSFMHKFGRIVLDDLMLESRYDKWRAYNQSKLANLLFCHELQARIDKSGVNVISVAAHPGYSATELQTKGAKLRGSSFGEWVNNVSNGLFAQSAAKGATPTLRAATDPEAKGGDYYGPSGFMEMGGPPVKVGRTRAARDPEVAKKLWDRSAELTSTAFASLAQ